MIGIDREVGVIALVLPGHQGAARAVGHDERPLLYAWGNADTQAVARPAGCDGSVRPHAGDVDVTVVHALVGPGNQGAALAIGDDGTEVAEVGPRESGKRRVRGKDETAG